MPTITQFYKNKVKKTAIGSSNNNKITETNRMNVQQNQTQFVT